MGQNLNKMMNEKNRGQGLGFGSQGKTEEQKSGKNLCESVKSVDENNSW
jgi:hypothetical protein